MTQLLAPMLLQDRKQKHAINIPVLYYHSIADHEVGHPWAFLSTPIRVFTRQMCALKRWDYHTIDWKELYDHLQGKTRLPKRTVMLQFDDGFLDNWSVVLPILKALGLRCTVLITRDFVEKTEYLREPVEATRHDNRRNWWGYLNCAELKAMEATGLVDIQCHGSTHTWYESGPRFLGLFEDLKKKACLPWLYWNRFPEEKPYWLCADWMERIPPKTVVLEHRKSLEVTRYFATDEYIELLQANCTMDEALRILGAPEKLGEYESESERKRRMRNEIIDVRDFLSSTLRKEPMAIVWPGGGKDDLAEGLAREAGLVLMSKGTLPNRFGSEIERIKRLAGAYGQNNRFLRHIQTALLRIQLLRGQNQALETAIARVRQVLRHA